MLTIQATIIKQNVHIIALCILIQIIQSCGFKKYAAKHHYTALTQQKITIALNDSFSMRYEKGKFEKRLDTNKITSLFDIKDLSSNNISFAIKSDIIVSISYINKLGQPQVLNLKGKQVGRSFYVKKKYRNIVIPLLYISRNIEKFYFSVAPNGYLAIHYSYINEGMLLFFGAGNSHQYTMLFPIVLQQ